MSFSSGQSIDPTSLLSGSPGTLSSRPPLLFLGRHRPQLQRMYAAVARHLVLKKRVHQPVPGGLHLGLEGVGRDDDAEVRLARRAAGHGLVVGVQVGVVEDFEAGGLEGGCYLLCG